MSDFTLYIGNKNYSSWSFRPWIGLKVAGIEFEEKLVPFEMAAGNPKFKEFSPTGKVPVLVDGDLVVAESLAILDHVARKFPEKNLWPSDERVRTLAMAASCEMLGGFSAIRNQCPMNLRRPIKRLEQDAALAKDVARIETLWIENLNKFGGDFLFGKFSIADAMFAPVVNRLEVYALTSNVQIRAYMERVKSLAAWQEWEAAGIKEPWIVEEDEA
ncbi:glutathione S-transferase family protein [Lentilitoribacter sp. Alg239-R112]|uniref:glutathione S-transferase family protein n=1 Tax=Lentilitoribacter sp. Alg239-R112 TaxID=2305987 RepID=UPI0013A6B53D|nr:glutathione S-transferase family protein [Lentilitoribacter sp. Alg239-R112]